VNGGMLSRARVHEECRKDYDVSETSGCNSVEQALHVPCRKNS
jgi:hypothetical protein